MTLRAGWTPVSYKITYELFGGENAEDNPASYDLATGDVTLAAPTRASYLFAGWYTDSTYETRVETVRAATLADVTLYARWTEKLFDITYELSGGVNSADNPDVYDITTGNVVLGSASRLGYIFTGWTLNGEPVTELDATLLCGITLVATWQVEEYTVTYDLGGGVNAGGNPATFDVETGNVTLAAPTRTGYTFSGWLLDGTPVTEIDVTLYRGITLVATWTAVLYDITYDLAGGVNAEGNPATLDGDTGDVALAAPTRAGYRFSGWLLDGAPVTVLEATLYKNVTVTATWEVVHYTVTYDLGGGVNAGGNPATFDVETGNVTLTAPTRAGYTFSGWYLDGAPVTEIDVTLYEDVTLVATWTAILYDITYDLAGGVNAESNPATFDAETGNVTLAEPTRTGYRFLGWYTTETFAPESRITVINVTILREITVYASWEVVKFEISYELGGGNEMVDAPFEFDVETGNVTLPTPTREGYTFTGWYSDPEKTKPITVIDVNILENVTLYADWRVTVYRIHYVLNGGENPYGAPVDYDITKGTLTLTEPTRAGYTFLGWYTDGEFAGEPITAVSLEHCTDAGVTVYARWKLNTYAVSYQLGGGTAVGENPTAYTAESGEIYLRTPTLTGFVFAGFYANAEGTGREIVSLTASLFDGAADGTALTLYAQWIPEAEAFAFRKTADGTGLILDIYYGFADTLVIPETVGGLPVTVIARSAFEGHRELLSVTIPSTVTAIEDAAFLGCRRLAAIALPEGLLTIGGGAFGNCSSLTELTVPDGITSIGNAAFGGCSSLTELTVPFVGMTEGATGQKALFGYIFGSNYVNGSLGVTQHYKSGNSTYTAIFSIPESLKTVTVTRAATLAPYAFENCAMLESLTLGGTLTRIEAYTFAYANALREISLPEGVTFLGEAAFIGCRSLAEIALPEGLASLGKHAFSGCRSLTEVTVPAGVTYIGSGVFVGCGGLTSLSLPFVGTCNERTPTTRYPNLGRLFTTTKEEGWIAVSQKSTLSGSSSTYYVPAGLTSVTVTGTAVDACAFYNCTFLTEILLADTVTAIGEGAFYGCKGLTSLALPNVTVIPASAFYQCEELSSLTLSPALTSIGTAAFQWCQKLSVLPSLASVTELGNYAFSNCTSLTGTVTLPAGLTAVPNGLFYNCKGITEVTLPASVTAIGQSAFGGCQSLTAVNIPAGVTAIGQSAFSGCSAIASLTLPETLVSIGGYAFTNCYGIRSVTLPATLTSLGNQAFNGCYNITEVRLLAPSLADFKSGAAVFGKAGTGADGNGVGLSVFVGKDVVRIPSYLFENYTTTSGIQPPRVVSVTFEEGSRLESIGANAFRGALVTSLTIPATVTSFGSGAFLDCTELTTLTVPFLGTAEGTGVLGNVFYTKALRNLTVLRGGVPKQHFMNLSGGDPARYPYGELRHVVLGEGVTVLGESAFSGATELLSVTLLGEVTAIPSFAFYECPKLTSLALPATVTEIGRYAFADAVALSEVNIPAGVTSLGELAFENTAITEITIPAGVTVLENGLFRGCTELATVTLAEGCTLTEIGPSVFSGCAKLTAFTIPTTVRTLGQYAFAGAGLITATVPEGVTVIPQRLFAGCPSLETVVFPASVTSFGNAPLFGCVSLRELTLPFVGSQKQTTTYASTRTEVLGALFCQVDTYNTKGFEGGVEIEQIYISYSGGRTGKETYTVPAGLEKITVLDGILPHGAFSGFASLTTVILSDTVTLSPYALYGCKAVTSLTLPKEAEVLPAFSLAGLHALPAITLPRGLVTIEMSALAELRSVTSLSLPGTVTTLGASSLRGCSALTSLTIPDGVTYMEPGFLAGCGSLKTLVLPYLGKTPDRSVALGSLFGTGGLLDAVDQVTGLEQRLEDPTYRYTSYAIPPSLTHITVKGGALYYGALSGMGSAEAPITVVLGEDVTSLGVACFACTHLSAITLPAGITAIPNYAFSNSTVGTVVLLGDVTTIGNYAFYKAKALTSVGPTDKVTSVGAYGFYAAEKLTSVSLPACTALGTKCFALSGLTSLTLGEGLTAIPELLCMNCPSLSEVVIPSTVTTIGNRAFMNCASLTSVRYNAVAATDLLASNGVFEGCGGAKDGITLTVGKDVTRIPAHLFGGSVCKLVTIVYAEGCACTEIGEGAFRGAAITEFVFPAGLTTIGAQAYYNCPLPQTLVIPSTVTSIGSSAFVLCAPTAVTLPYLGYSATEPTFASAILSCGEGATVTVLGGTVKNNAFSHSTKLKTVVLGDGVTAIGDAAFRGCTGLESVTLGTGITVIPTECFYECTALPSLTLRGAVTEVGSHAFYRASALSELLLPDSLTVVGSHAFAFTALTGTLDLHNVVTVGEGAFSRTGIGSVVMPKVETIGVEAFFYCEALTTVEIPATCASIGYRAFGMTALSSVSFGNAEGWIYRRAYTQNPPAVEIAAAELSDPTAAAAALRTTYVQGTLTRS